MLAAYANARRVCADGLLGKGASPTCGLAPGCPAATDWLALVMYPWLAKSRALNEQVSARAYVDDQTSWSVSEECVEDVQSLVALTDGLGRDLRLKANDIKSRRFATCKVAEGALRGLAGPPVGHWFKDLGSPIHGVSCPGRAAEGATPGGACQAGQDQPPGSALPQADLDSGGLGGAGSHLWHGSASHAG